MEIHSMRRLPKAPLLDEVASVPSSLRSSLDDNYYHRQACHVDIYEDTHRAEGKHLPNSKEDFLTLSWHSSCDDVEELGLRLRTRDTAKPCWINVTGWSKNIVSILETTYLGNHNFLELNDLSRQMLGGPTAAPTEQTTRVWSVGRRIPEWSSMREVTLRMILCLPTPTDTGILITNFLGPHCLAEEMSKILVGRVLDNNALDWQGLGCVWVLAFTMLGTIAEQLNIAFDCLDPINRSAELSRIPKLDDLPTILEDSNRLARIDRHLSSLEETVSFLLLVQQQLAEDIHRKTPVYHSSLLPGKRDLGVFEAVRTREKLHHQQRLGQTYMRQYDTLIQLIISYSTTQITDSLNQGRRVGEQLAKIGIFIAGIAGLVAPLSLLTGFYGMNVQELTSQANGTLFGFWQIGIPVFLLTIVSIVFGGMWVITKSDPPRGRT